MKKRLVSVAALLLACGWCAIWPAYSQDVWIKGNLSLWVLAPQGKGDWARMGRDSYVSLEANLTGRRSLLWSYCAFDFPKGSNGAMDQFFLTVGKSRGSTRLGRFYVPFGSEAMEKYDKYVEPNDPGAVKNPFFDHFGDGVCFEKNFGRAAVTLAAVDLAFDANSSPDLFGRARVPLGPVECGVSYYREAGGPGAYATEADLKAVLGPLTVIGEALTGRPLEERAKAHFAAVYLPAGSGELFFKYGSYEPDSGPRAVTRKVGFSRPFRPLGSIRVWWQGNRISDDQIIVELRVPL
jgi:hypothetical protein